MRWRPHVLRRLFDGLRQRRLRGTGLAVRHPRRGRGRRRRRELVGRPLHALLLHLPLLPGLLDAHHPPRAHQLPPRRQGPDVARALAGVQATDPRPHGGDRLRAVWLALGLPPSLRHARLLSAVVRGCGLVVHGFVGCDHVPARRRGADDGHGAQQEAGPRRHPEDHSDAHLHPQGRQPPRQQTLRHLLHGLAVQRRRDAEPGRGSRAGNRRRALLDLHRRHLRGAEGHLRKPEVP
mmetsp:Transcript_38151/g.109475  ORF Transcript_38151/g.109475 Transcript_38151/m.109475 type:complete len:236 (-) Transcript_38151:866-1573(-)